MNFSEDEIVDLIDKVFRGNITEYDLPEDLYDAIAAYLKKGVYEGFGVPRRNERLLYFVSVEGVG